MDHWSPSNQEQFELDFDHAEAWMDRYLESVYEDPRIDETGALYALFACLVHVLIEKGFEPFHLSEYAFVQSSETQKVLREQNNETKH